MQEKLEAFDALVVSHHRYYQFYSHMFLAVPVWCACGLVGESGVAFELPGFAGVVALELVFFLGSRDALKKYHARTEELLEGGGKRILRVGF